MERRKFLQTIGVTTLGIGADRAVRSERVSESNSFTRRDYRVDEVNGTNATMSYNDRRNFNVARIRPRYRPLGIQYRLSVQVPDRVRSVVFVIRYRDGDWDSRRNVPRNGETSVVFSGSYLNRIRHVSFTATPTP